MISSESAVVSAIALVVLSGCFVLVRFVARLAFVKHVGPDDILIVLAWAAAVALAIVTHQQRQHDDSSTSSSTEEQNSMTRLLRQLWASNFTYDFAVLLLKDSLLLQYLRFSIDTGYRRACWALGAIVTAYGVAALFVGIFSCRPVAFSWDNDVSSGRCINFLAFWLFNASFNSATDIIVFCLPVPVLRALQLPKHQMGMLSSIFVLGAFVCIASVVRLTAVYSATFSNQNNPSIAIWSTVEVNIGIICACLPSFRHPLVQLWPRILDVKRRLTSVHHVPRTSTALTEETHGTEKTTVSFDLRPCTSTSEAGSSRYSRTTWHQSDEEAATPQSTPSPPASNLELEPSWPSIATAVESPNDDRDINNNKALPLPPLPSIPAPVARPSGPRPDPPTARPQIHRSRSYYLRDPSGWRFRFQLGSIPEADSQRGSQLSLSLASPNSKSKSRSPSKSPSKTPPPQLLLQAAPPISPPTHPSSRSAGNSSYDGDKSYRKIAPWSAQPPPGDRGAPPKSPGSSTYSYEILGGPKALAAASSSAPPTAMDRCRVSLIPSLSSLSPTKSKREDARRERERTRRKEREREREDDRLQERERQRRLGERPRGPREMSERGTGALSYVATSEYSIQPL
ncbi:hypothetical protein LTR41_000978 [Exophiala xenobiotica]|nr:hypothetical protein LTR41_000978 [Exophiala xenobiotica]